jgi:hypothetical protein
MATHWLFISDTILQISIRYLPLKETVSGALLNVNAGEAHTLKEYANDDLYAATEKQATPFKKFF